MVGGVGLLFVASAGVIGGLALHDQQQGLVALEGNTKDASEEALTWNDQAQRKALLSNVFYGVGGGLVITGVILYFVLRPRTRSPQSPATSREMSWLPQVNEISWRQLSHTPVLREGKCH